MIDGCSFIDIGLSGIRDVGCVLTPTAEKFGDKYLYVDDNCLMMTLLKLKLVYFLSFCLEVRLKAYVKIQLSIT